MCDIVLNKSAAGKSKMSLSLQVFLIKIVHLIHLHRYSSAGTVIKSNVNIQISLVVWDRSFLKVTLFTLSHFILSDFDKIEFHLDDGY